MRVLQINSVCGTGSTGRLATQISDYLTALGVENSIAYGFGSSDHPNTFKFGNMLDAHIHSFISRKLCMQGYASPVTTWKLIRYMKKWKPDIVHLHNIHGHYLNFPLLFRYLKSSDCQIIWTFHDCWPMTGKCTHFTKVKCEKWKTQCHNCPQLNTYPDSIRDRSYQNYQDKKKYFLLSQKLHIVTVSQWLKETVENSFFFGRDIRCIYNGIDINIFNPTPSDIRNAFGIGDKFMILGVATVWNNSKGFDKFLDLARDLDSESIIVLVGVSEQQKASLPEKIIGISRTENQHQLAQFYSSADVLVSFSEEETFGLVVAEALACGTPAIVINSTASPEVVCNQTGFVIESGEIIQLNQALNTIRIAGKHNFSDKCKARAGSLFSKEKMLKQYYTLYKELEKCK